MKHYDYEWDLGPYGIILDQELNTDNLGWQGGDYFKLVNINGTQLLEKVDPIEVFAKGHKVNSDE
jgi:hypothetical protein